MRKLPLEKHLHSGLRLLFAKNTLHNPRLHVCLTPFSSSYRALQICTYSVTVYCAHESFQTLKKDLQHCGGFSVKNGGKGI